MRGGRREGSGRPPGRRNVLTVTQKRSLTEIARDYSEAALETLALIMTDPASPAAARITAANALLDRGHGRPVQSAPPTERKLDLSLLTIEELDALESAIRLVEAAQSRAPARAQ